jgi:hypothetical protein
MILLVLLVVVLILLVVLLLLVMLLVMLLVVMLVVMLLLLVMLLVMVCVCFRIDNAAVWAWRSDDSGAHNVIVGQHTGGLSGDTGSTASVNAWSLRLLSSLFYNFFRLWLCFACNTYGFAGRFLATCAAFATAGDRYGALNSTCSRFGGFGAFLR